MGKHHVKGSEYTNQEWMNMTCKGKFYQKHGCTKSLVGCFFLLVIYHQIDREGGKWKLANTNKCLRINITSAITICISLVSVMLQLYTFSMNQAFIQGKWGRECCNSKATVTLRIKGLTFQTLCIPKPSTNKHSWNCSTNTFTSSQLYSTAFSLWKHLPKFDSNIPSETF